LDLLTVSSEAAALIAPFLPKLVSGGKLIAGEALKEIGKQMGTSTWGGAKDVWDKLHRVADTPAGRERLGEIAREQDPNKRASELGTFIGDVLAGQPQVQLQLAKAIQNISHSTNINITIT
jgi:hypothetical protein